MNLIIITGISGSGKTTVGRRLNELGHTAFDSKINPGLFHFIDNEGNLPVSNHPNDPEWKTLHKWVIDTAVLDQLMSTHQAAPLVFLCGGGDSLKALWPRAKKIFLLTIDSDTLAQRLNHPSRDNAFGTYPRGQQALLDRLDAYQKNMESAGAIPIDAQQPIDTVIKDILENLS